MMKKSININEASIIDLKAELFRKEEQFKLDQTSQVIKDDSIKALKGSKTFDKIAILTGKKKIPQKRKHEDKKSNDTVKSVNLENDAEYAKAKLKLESKAKLYEKMKKGEIEDPEEEGESFYLVDFHKKVYGDDADVAETSSKNDDSGEEWVEFEDSLGRQRKCMKKDLERFKSLDPEFRPKNRTPSPPTVMSEDMRREMMRQKWEEEQEKLMQVDRDIHYQNILFDEVREHGVAYYQFSKDEAERRSQMEALNKLREQTVEQRAKREAIKQKRKAAIDARLAKIRQKKSQKQDTSSSGNKESQADPDDMNCKPETNELFVPNVSLENSSQKSKTSELFVNESETEKMKELPGIVHQNPDHIQSSPSNENKHVLLNNSTEQRQKPTNRLMGTKSAASRWISALREERNEEFAPPSFYYQGNSKSETTQIKDYRKNKGAWKQ